MFGGVLGSILGVFGRYLFGYFRVVFRNVLEVFMSYFGRCSEGKNKVKIIEIQRIHDNVS